MDENPFLHAVKEEEEDQRKRVELRCLTFHGRNNQIRVVAHIRFMWLHMLFHCHLRFNVQNRASIKGLHCRKRLLWYGPKASEYQLAKLQIKT
ncbi:hypothetical protein ACMD2_14309 [Ananas comosus]|uniref:Uncharacterized protein n=1 Tax=Ananas comosus TaxID=4615 RepID=A0A199W6A0_ANACO|nr:hypothetical protein ACMD2_14309 [Ananas comosus]